LAEIFLKIFSFKVDGNRFKERRGFSGGIVSVRQGCIDRYVGGWIGQRHL
jgi:hypothetical protein